MSGALRSEGRTLLIGWLVDFSLDYMVGVDGWVEWNSVRGQAEVFDFDEFADRWVLPVECALWIGQAGADVEAGVHCKNFWNIADERTEGASEFAFAFDNSNTLKFVVLPVFALEEVPAAIVFVGEELASCMG